MTTFLSDIVLAGANDIQFKNTSGANTGKIESDGNNLVLSNAVGDILLGDGASDVYIGDGTNNVDILFEQSGSIKAEDGSSGVTLTLGSGDTTLALGSSISSTLTVGVDDTGYDVKFFGATSGRYILWDESDDSLKFTDNTKIKLGTGDDLEIYHDGSHSFIVDNGTGNLWIGSNGGSIYLGDEGANETFLKATDNGNVELYYDNAKKFETVTGGVLVTGELEATTLDINGNADISGTLTVADNKVLGYATGERTINSSSYAMIGTVAGDRLSSIVELTLTGTSNSVVIAASFEITVMHSQDIFVKSMNGDYKDIKIKITSNNNEDFSIEAMHTATATDTPMEVCIFPKAGETCVVTGTDPGYTGVEHEHTAHEGTCFSALDNSTTGHRVLVNGELEATALDINGNADISGTLTSGGNVTITGGSDIFLADNGKTHYGASNDLEVYHDGSNSYVTAKGTGDLIIQNTTDNKDIIFQSDDGSGGVETYFFLDGSLSSGSPFTVFPDNARLALGSSTDMYMYHNGTDTTINNDTGDLYIKNSADDKDIIFQSDDGSGGNATYLTIDGGAAITTVSREMRFFDNVKLKLGSGPDLEIYHDGSNSYITQSGTGHLQIRQTQDDKDIKFECDDGSGGTTTYFYLDGSSATNIFSKDVLLSDNISLKVGNAADMKLYHDGSNSYINQQGTGDLYLRQNTDDGDIIFQSDDGSGGLATYLTLDGSAAETKVDKDMRFSDNVNLRIGTNSDVIIVHDNSNFTTTNYTGNYNIINQQVDGDIVFQTDDGSGGVETYLTIDGGSQEIIATKPIVTGESQIKVLPHHFMSNEDGGANKSAQFRDDTIIGVRTSADSAELYAFVEIPYGKTATNVTVYGNDTNLAVNVYESDINAGALTDKTPEAGCRVGTACDITDVAYSATNYLAIKVTTTSYTNDIVYGAVVTIT